MDDPTRRLYAPVRPPQHLQERFLSWGLLNCVFDGYGGPVRFKYQAVYRKDDISFTQTKEEEEDDVKKKRERESRQNAIRTTEAKKETTRTPIHTHSAVVVVAPSFALLCFLASSFFLVFALPWLLSLPFSFRLDPRMQGFHLVCRAPVFSLSLVRRPISQRLSLCSFPPSPCSPTLQPGTSIQTQPKNNSAPPARFITGDSSTASAIFFPSPPHSAAGPPPRWWAAATARGPPPPLL